MTNRIALPDWVEAASTQRVLAALTVDGAEVRFVGGCVRDALLDRPVGDIDLATDARPETVQRLLGDAAIKSIPTGIEHGTVGAFADGQLYEITTLRRDIETDGRHAKVAFGTDWLADAARRDFTFNALSLSVDGTLHDPFDGQSDLEAGRVRFVGQAVERVREDILRILRWFRFHAHYGRGDPDPEALGACRGFAYRIPDLSGERVRHEMLRLLSADDPAASLELMVETDVIDAVLGRGTDLSLLKGLLDVEEAAKAAPDPLLRFAALIADAAKITPLAKRLRLSNAERDRLAAALRPEPAISPDASAGMRRNVIYRAGAETVRDRVLLAWAAAPASGAWAPWLTAAETFSPPRFPLEGRDVTGLGVAQGPLIGELLRKIENWWVERDFEPGRDACLAELKSTLQR